jgi:peptidoglycan/xylan/chitin deacetylase (PgdA/CDA1 family)
MYHELGLPGRPPCQSEPAYLRYIVSAADFESQMHWLRNMGWRGMSVTEALSSPHENGVVVTFDDGCETDLLSAAPILNGARFGATFYITVGFLGKRGYLSHDQLRELSDQGFDIGCHSMTHSYLSDCLDDRLHQEVAGAKTELEQITGRRVEHFSCPGGRWSPRVVEVARWAGYRSIVTSYSAANPPQADLFFLGRVAVMRGTSLKDFQRLCHGHGLWKLQVRDLTRSSAQRLFGNSTYDRIRSLWLNLSLRER